MEQFRKVRGIAQDLDVAKVTIRGVPDRPGIAVAIFQPLSDAHISVDTIVQNASVEQLTDVTFTVSRKDLHKVLPIVQEACRGIDATDLVTDDKLGKVSIIGTGMTTAPGYAALMFRTLFEEGINIDMISTSEIRITCIVDESKVPDAVRALHRAFELDKEE